MEPTGLQLIVNQIGQLVQAAGGWVGSTVSVITANPLILFSSLVGFVGIGIGLLKRFFKLHA